MHVIEPEIIVGRRAFSDAQVAMEGVGEPYGDTFYSLSWYGTALSDESGSFCIVDEKGPLKDLVGDFLRFRYGRKSVCAYCVAGLDIVTDVAVTRRVFAAVSLLSVQQIDVEVDVLS